MTGTDAGPEPWTSPIPAPARTTDRFEMRGEESSSWLEWSSWLESEWVLLRGGERRRREESDINNNLSTPLQAVTCHATSPGWVSWWILLNYVTTRSVQQSELGTIFIPPTPTPSPPPVWRVKWLHICYWLLRRLSGYCRMWGNHWWPGTTRAVFVQWERPIPGNLICR